MTDQIAGATGAGADAALLGAVRAQAVECLEAVHRLGRIVEGLALPLLAAARAVEWESPARGAYELEVAALAAALDAVAASAASARSRYETAAFVLDAEIAAALSG